MQEPRYSIHFGTWSTIVLIIFALIGLAGVIVHAVRFLA